MIFIIKLTKFYISFWLTLVSTEQRGWAEPNLQHYFCKPREVGQSSAMAMAMATVTVAPSTPASMQRGNYQKLRLQNMCTKLLMQRTTDATATAARRGKLLPMWLLSLLLLLVLLSGQIESVDGLKVTVSWCSSCCGCGCCCCCTCCQFQTRVQAFAI